ncbi:hypothetical protein GTQ40_10175 [Flavobacteriaceae bacterium R38]|nr:hypothetical protein [Flavobacteriaceae bacterium R38]
MFKRSALFFLLMFSLVLWTSCSSDGDDQPVIEEQGEDITDNNSDDDSNDGDNDNDDNNDGETASLATNGCSNVVIFNNYAYAACGGEIEVVSLTTLERNLLSISADDIAVDTEAGLLFIQSRNTVQVLTLDNPMEPSIAATASTNFSIFSGVAAANGVLVISGGSGNSDTQVFNYTASSISLVTDGIAVVDNVTGNPDVHVTPTPDGITAFYSQDLGNVANWGIQIVSLNTNAQVTDTPPVVVLTPGQFNGSFAPFGNANFPVESEFLNNQLYVAHFAAQGIEVIDLENNNTLSLISLPYEPTNIGTDGTSLFVVGITNDSVDIIDPSTATVVDSLGDALQQATGVAASETHIAVADRSEGLIIIAR